MKAAGRGHQSFQANRNRECDPAILASEPRRRPLSIIEVALTPFRRSVRITWRVHGRQRSSEARPVRYGTDRKSLHLL